MTIEITFPDAVQLDARTTTEYRGFLQAAANRRTVGALRYSDRPHRRQRYMSRLARELSAYRKTGNVEHLFNIANYAFLESSAPENPKSHWDKAVESVTRGEFGTGR